MQTWTEEDYDKPFYFMDCPDDEYVRTRKRWVIYPNNKVYQLWDLFMTVTLILSCFLTPYEIAFPNHETGEHDKIKWGTDKAFDILFFIQIILNF